VQDLRADGGGAPSQQLRATTMGCGDRIAGVHQELRSCTAPNAANHALPCVPHGTGLLLSALKVHVSASHKRCWQRLHLVEGACRPPAA